MTAASSPAASASPVPEWHGVATLAELPSSLTWSGTRPVPAIGARVHAHMNGLGVGTVRHYFHAGGYLGVIVAVDELPEWFVKQNPGITEGHFFGRELEPYEPRAQPGAELRQAA